MKYMGSKARFTKDILPIILKERLPNQYFVDLFTGGANVVSLVDGNRIANDKNKYLIAMFKGLQQNMYRPNEIPKDLYDVARDIYYGKATGFNHLMLMDDFMVGWIGWMGSANGRFFDGGYSGKSNTKIGTIRDYIKEAINNIERQIPKLKGIDFYDLHYKEVAIPNNSIVYCDIPYEKTKQYSTSKGFNHLEFWDYARKLSTEGHSVFVSEYNAPQDFKCIWQKEAKSSLSANGQIGGNKCSTEKLFKYIQ
jgi:DNA adenine methylase